ncbi:hypothetical protein HRbin24_00658 [bacterium HR24]|nr:hypothetical protein HRbin24_00658 [bacterium HR24]
MPQGRMQQMGAGMVAHSVLSVLAVHLGQHLLAGGDDPFCHSPAVNDDAFRHSLRVDHRHAPAGADDLAPVAHLAPAFWIERRLREDHFHLGRGRDLVGPGWCAVLDDQHRQHPGGRFQGVVAHEGRLSVGQVGVGIGPGDGPGGAGGRPGTLPLLFH